ncbi:MAG: mandelate racemase/muconate lactonizing enzyme family protein [Cyclobacteriaceae bacterium]|nr:mandelate racemase/muconate lactonizing enzyme family protein [Cyclobacteriaceae bacterium]
MKLSRLNFLKTLGLSPLLLSPISSYSETLEKKTVKNSGVKITKVKTFATDHALYVKIETDAGISGWGEGDHFNTKITSKIIHEIFNPLLVGQDPFNSNHLWNNLFFEGFEGGSTGFVPGSLGGVDNALWDLKGKITGLPVSKLLGGNKLEKVAVYGSYGRKKENGIKSINEMVSEGMAFVEQGYKTIKARMQLYDRGRNPEGDYTFTCIKEIRKAVGENIDIFVDFNNGYTAGKAIELGLKLYEHCNIKVVEEPVSSMDYPGLRQVVEALPCDVNAGEHEYNKWQFRDLITVGNPDCLNIDTAKCAGITECYKISAMGHAFEKEVMVHNTRPTLATASSLNLIGAIANPAKVQEFSGMRPELNLQVYFNNSLKFENGFLFIPTTPGLGLEVNEKAMAKYEIKP